MLITDLIAGGFGIIEKIIIVHKVNEWVKLIFGFIFTFITAYCGACGGFLISGHSLLVSTGYGLLAAGGAITALFFYNPKTKGIMIVQDKEHPLDVSEFQAVIKNK